MASTEREKQIMREYQARFRGEVRDIVRELKGTTCWDCGLEWPDYVLQFDHVQGTKEFAISEFVYIGSYRTMQRLYDEIAKCEVVCGNCHAIREHNRREERKVA
jgi:hypothetical protein